MSSSPHRLVDQVRPHHYDLVLEPDLSAATFAGSVTIRVEALETVERIVLHALDLDLDRAEVRSGGSGDLAAVTDTEFDPDAETVTLVLDRPLPAGTAELEMDFRGMLNDQLVGFYRSTFSTEGPDGDATEHTLAVTQFESTHARRAFPCFDEPALKASFGITVVTDAAHFVVSNAAEVDRSPLDDGRVRVRFADTITMSTYLVALVVGPLEATEPRMVAGVDGPIPLRVVHPPGKGHLSGFALDVAEAALRFFEDYYDLPYPGDKVDLVAVPDFAFGAMENLGCVTFREVLLLVDPSAATQPELQRVADVINHELAHMWFGDLVTMRWWNGIWLNEAFATFMEITATDAFRPEWDVWTTFGLARAAAFDTDTLASTRPIEYEVVTAADAEGMFDILTYEKGASVVRMLEQYLGAEVFRSGIAAYLRRHAYGSTETTDLWDALEEISGEPVRRIMDDWIFRGGHPVVQVRSGTGGVELDQVRASFDGEHDGERWPIPMVLSVAGGDTPARTERLLLEDPARLDTDGAPGVVQANVGGAGFYRVELDAGLRSALVDAGTAGPLERFVLLDDTWAGLVAGRVALSDAVDLLRRLAEDETDPSVWRRIGSACRELARLAGPDHRDDTRAFITSLAVPALERVDSELGRDGDSTASTERLEELRGILFALAGADGAHDPTRDRARAAFDSALGEGTPGEDGPLDPSLRAAVIEVVASAATAEEHRRLEQRWRAAGTPQEELRYLNALVDADDVALFDHAVGLALGEVRTQNAPYLLRRAIAHPSLGPRGWSTVTDRWDEVTRRFPSNSLPRMLEGVRAVTDAEVAAEVRAFLAERPVPTGERQVDQHLERMGVGVTAAARVRAELAADPDLLGADG